MTYAPISLSPEAAQRVTTFLESASADDGTCLRVGVNGGGCSGFQYQLALDKFQDGDVRFSSEGQDVIVSEQTLPIVAGSHIIWQETPTGSGFDVKNPNATAACGCGNSFRVDDQDGCDSEAA